ncbi:hypothetical protein ACHWQZ_G007232 [Mnemiopsis leidyi]
MKFDPSRIICRITGSRQTTKQTNPRKLAQEKGKARKRADTGAEAGPKQPLTSEHLDSVMFTLFLNVARQPADSTTNSSVKAPQRYIENRSH